MAGIISKTAGEALRDARVKAKVTYKKVAEKSGMNNYQYVQKVMNPKYNARTNTFVAIANALGYDVIMRDRVTDEEVLIISSGGDDE
ncbi:MAG: helix-turn-helix transcriptional regulator [Bacteroidaceae bacterium]|nr:helix-turn-helix transcriptional regulator [Bacteroidaceae bacterium]